MSTHNVDINVSANTKGAEKSLGYLQSLMSEFGKLGTSKIAGLLGAAAVAKMAFDKVSESISKNIATAKQVSQMAIKFNIDPRAMHSITMAANDAGVSVRALTMAMKQMGKYAEKGMGSKEIQVNFKHLGIEADKLSEIQAKPSKFLPAIAKSLMEIGDENQRAAAGALLLGRQYQMLLPLIEELGTSEEARQKFLDNENAMTEDQIKANKEIAEIQNDLSDNFDKMVASAAPLLNWAMNFVNLLAQGLGFIKDMIFETEQAKKERESKSIGDVGRKIARYQETLKAKEESGTLSDEEKKGIEEAGSVEKYVALQTEKMDKAQKAKSRATAAIMKIAATGGDEVEQKRVADFSREQFKIAEENDASISQSYFEALGVGKSQWGEEGFFFNDDKRKAYLQAGKDVNTAVFSGDLEKVAKLGITEANKGIRKKEDDAREANMKSKVGKYVKTKKSQAALIGQIYDPATDRMYDKTEYQYLLESRGIGKDEAALQIKTFEDEATRIKREKTDKRSERALKATERKLYVGGVEGGQMVSGDLEGEAKAYDNLLDVQEARTEAQEDLNEQVEIMKGMEEELETLQEDEVKNAADILRVQGQLSNEMIKKRELQGKVNQALFQEQAAVTALRKEREKAYWEEKKRVDDMKGLKDAEADHELSLKYKLMQAEGASRQEIAEAKAMDSQIKYAEMLKEYEAEYREYMTNDEKGKEIGWFGQKSPLSETEEKRLQEKTKALEAQQRNVLDAAFDFGNQGDTGRVSDMRRIGGGGMEYGGLANTARSQLDEARKATKALQEMVGYMRNGERAPYSPYVGDKSGLDFVKPKGSLIGEIKSVVFGSDAQPSPQAPKIDPNANGGIFGGRGPRVDEFGRTLW
jgi:hypothetical protein